MEPAKRPSSDVAFSPAVKAVQAARGSREAYRKREEKGGFRTEVDEDLRDFLAEIDTAFLSTASASGQPYVQHRGGPRGFLRVLGPTTLGFADFMGNRQYVSTGNLTENDRFCLIAVDYEHRRRVKIWGHARVVDADDDLARALTVPGYPGRVEQAVVLEVTAWDVNCPQHIPQKVDAKRVAERVAELVAEAAALREENAKLREKIAVSR